MYFPFYENENVLVYFERNRKKTQQTFKTILMNLIINRSH